MAASALFRPECLLSSAFPAKKRRAQQEVLRQPALPASPRISLPRPSARSSAPPLFQLLDLFSRAAYNHGMLRLLTLLLIIMLSYFILKTWLWPEAPRRRQPTKSKAGAEAGEEEKADLAQDPICLTYVEEKSSPFVVHEGHKFFFCSEACRQKFLARHHVSPSTS